MSTAPPLPRKVRTSDSGTRVVEYGPDLRLVPQVKQWVRTASGLGRSAEPLTRVAAALYENALAHTVSGLPEGRTRIVVTRRPHCLHLAVKDQGPLPGTGTSATPVPKAGSGLSMVEELATRWGWYGDQRGRTVWAELPLSTD